jgi:hypothetical protein
MSKQLRDESMSDPMVTTEYSFMLKPSQIDIGGVGVFASHDIASSTYLKLFDLDDLRMIDLKTTNHFFVERFGVPAGDQSSCPKDFGRMSIGWYLNHSSNPNAYLKNDRYYALRNIHSGEEIMIDYETLYCSSS